MCIRDRAGVFALQGCEGGTCLGLAARCAELHNKAAIRVGPRRGRRRLGLPVLYPHVAPKDARTDAGRLAAKVPAMFGVDARGYDFVAEIAPQAGDLLLPKKHPSAFFGTPLLSHLIDLGVDTLFVTGCSTSGCVRASVVDAFSYNFRVVVPQDCVFDRSPTSHAVNLFDMNAKYADVVPVAEGLAMLAALPQGDAAAAGAAS